MKTGILRSGVSETWTETNHNHPAEKEILGSNMDPNFTAEGAYWRNRRSNDS